uniref:Small EDRK-rich factor-like N-terminal domain-containing protein n=1 Tax=Glycine max TaxID=3847 RepID=A0A0R0IWY0_SOYBN
MTRGSQRDRDRERAQARTGAKGKQKDDGLTPEQRRERLEMQRRCRRRPQRKRHRVQEGIMQLEAKNRQ